MPAALLATVFGLATGSVGIVGDEMLFLNFGDRARADAFLGKRLAQGWEGATMKSFRVPRSLLDDLRATGLPERLARQFPDRPLVVDVAKAADQFGLRPQQIETLRRAIIQGSGKPGL
jgi:filamentous hemagglutinin